ncbi:MAG: lipopolysaccharide heptosyltransferase II [Pseudomonadota bacterium]
MAANADISADGSRSAILVIGPAWVGDMVMAQSLVGALKQRWPDRPVDVVAPGSTRPLLGYMPGVRASIGQRLGHGQFNLKARRTMGRALRDAGYGTAIVLPRSWKSALVPYFAGIPERIGYWGEARIRLLTHPRRLDKSALPRTVDRFVALAGPARGPAPEVISPTLNVDPTDTERALARLELEDGQARILALCPGAEYGPAKRWPSRHGATLAAQAVSAGWTVWLIGGPGDRQIAEEIKTGVGEQLNGIRNLAGETDLAEAVALLARADAVVSNDSGLMHVAAALGRPQIALFGSSSAAHTPPLSDKAQVLSLDLECQPCFKRECPLGHFDCLNKLMPAQVFQALDRL